MHEVAIAESLIELIEREALARAFLCVTIVRVQLGALGHVEPEALRFCFAAVAEGTLAEGAALEIETVAGEGWCADCSRSMPLAERYDACSACGRSGLRITAGAELRLAELEVQ
jgi:hydrogenase nickel incorporation protein HypA/HybF